MQVVVGELMSLYLLVKCTTSRVLWAAGEYSAQFASYYLHEGGGITGAAVLPGLSGEVLHLGVGEEEVLRLRGWIREVLGFHFFLVFLGKYN